MEMGGVLLIMSSPLPICLSGVKMRKRRVAVVVAMLGVCGVARSQPIASVHGAPIGSIVTVNGVLTAKPLLTARDSCISYLQDESGAIFLYTDRKSTRLNSSHLVIS